jgi:hypothetical protein
MSITEAGGGIGDEGGPEPEETPPTPAPFRLDQTKGRDRDQDQDTTSDHFSSMSLDARSWFLYRRQAKIYRLIAVVLSMDPDATEIPWSTQQELAALVKDARDYKGKATQRREKRTTTITNVLRYILGGVGLALVFKIAEYLTLLSHITKLFPSR